MNCVGYESQDVLSGIGSTFVRFWRGRPELEALYVSLLFPNSTFTFDPLIAPLTSRLELEDCIRPSLYAPYKRTRGLYFLTCADIVEIGALSLLRYVSALDVPTWMSFAITSFLMAIVLIKVAPKKGFSECMMTCISVLLEQGTSTNPKKIRWMTGLWIMAGIVL